MALISIKAIAEHARAKGFQVNGGERYLEIWEPKHEGAKAVWHFDSCYSTSQYTVHDRPCGYGYNDWFNGPWHNGFTQDTWADRLLSHPLMADFKF